MNKKLSTKEMSVFSCVVSILWHKMEKNSSKMSLKSVQLNLLHSFKNAKFVEKTFFFSCRKL